METLRTEKLCKTLHGTFKLGPLDLRVSAGEILAVIGPHGAGRTTLLRLLWGFIRPDGGAISLFGMEPHLNQVKVRMRAGYLADHPYFSPNFTARRHLQFIGSFYEGWDESRSEYLLKQFGVEPDVEIQELSHQERTKIGLIAALGHRPSLLILDEPLTGLDPITRHDILLFLKRLASKDETSIVLSADISDDLDQLADSILMLNHGHVVEYARSLSQLA